MVIWQSSDASVATVSAEGLVTAVKNGVARITATSGNASAGVDVTVESLPPSPDRDILVTLYNTMGGPDWFNKTNWLSDKHVEAWHGVNTDEEGRVTTLNLGRNNLKGQIPIQLAQLSSLEGLSLEGNQLTGSIPREMSELVSLTLMYLFDNQLTGSIPHELGKLFNLIHLCLNGNRLSGSVPPELSGLKNLKWLHLHDNMNLSGSLPTTLIDLDLDALLLQGTQVCLPDNPGLKNWLNGIEDVRIYECEGFDPDRIVLEAIYIATNGPNWTNNQNWSSDAPVGQWYGVETDHDGRVVGLSLPRNGLSGIIPPEVGRLVDLTRLDLRDNTLSGTIPVEVGRLTNLRTLNLGRNSLSGAIPGELGQLPDLTDLVLQYNTFSGPIPVEAGQFTSLKNLNLRDNRLSGTIPPELGSLTNLRELHLQFNNLSGIIPPELGGLTNLSSLVLWKNKLTGVIPDELGQLTNLRDIDLGYNQLTGIIPAELGQLTNLTYLYLGPNQLTGIIPAELGQLENLRTLFLRSNNLSGAVPSELGRLTNMDFLQLGLNPLLTGPLPIELTAMKKIRSLNLYGTQLCVPDKPAFREWLGELSNHDEHEWEFLYFNICNPDRDALTALYRTTQGENWHDAAEWLSGKSPNQWFGLRTNAAGRVEELDLENNNLRGSLPSELGSMIDLRRLILGGNPLLAGILPGSLVDLPLETLHLVGTGLCAPVDAGFQSWLSGIPQKNGVVNCEADLDDRGVLIKLYHTTDGANWLNNTNWNSDLPLDQWFGVTTDTAGRVTELVLESNDVTGPLLPDLGHLTGLTRLSFVGNSFTGNIPPELGQLTGLTSLELTANQLTGEIPPELGQLTQLIRLDLYINKLTGSIPSELGRLANLERLRLNSNELTGSIPVEMSRLAKVWQFNLGRNKLTGSIPPEIGQIPDLKILDLGRNELTGGIPPELGNLTNLEELRLGENKLTGRIPPELGNLTPRLFYALDLHSNHLTGSIPPELGHLTHVRSLNLSGNELTDRIPPELARMARLEALEIENNQLTGSIPGELGELAELKSLKLTGNSGLSGPIPVSLTRLDLETLTLDRTRICMPPDTEIQRWFQRIASRSSIAVCHSPMNVEVYLTQSVQSFIRPVPLIEGESALLRVFFATEESVVNRPAVLATFYVEGSKADSLYIPAGATKVPAEIDEGSLDESANAVVPAEMIRPGLELVIEIDPGGMADPESGITARVPAEGRMPVDVRSVPPLDLTIVPFLWREDPDYTIVDRTEGLTAEDDLFRLTRDLLPVGGFSLSVHEPVWTSVDPIFDNRLRLLRETYAVRVMDGIGGHYMGVLRYGGGTAGQTTFVAGLNNEVIAHELGHLMSLLHAPCQVTAALDPVYPYADGSIGAWGYNLVRNVLIDPHTPDIMGYCRGREGISDYHFNKAIEFRLNEEEDVLRIPDSSEQLRTLLVWGGLGEFGEIMLESAFVVDAAPYLPHESGPYRLAGEDTDGDTLFRLDFDIDALSHSDRGGAFAFAVPVQQAWTGRLARITLSGPEGFTEITGNGDRSAALLLDQSTGQVRGILRDWPEPGESVESMRRVLPEPGLETVISNGLPHASDW
ncbi:MAG: Ig-like domain-containing protein [Chloroflexota bacterium]|nr:Ig-like domain-containing protein [Chloroflexota bacterium]